MVAIQMTVLDIMKSCVMELKTVNPAVSLVGEGLMLFKSVKLGTADPATKLQLGIYNCPKTPH